ncbi:MAG: hypothetical protein ACKV2Q_27510 [Planctomycetaceae bacterium]
MPDLLIAPILLLAVSVGWLGVLRLARGVRHTSLTAAAAWAIWFQVTLTVTTIATLAKDRVPLGILDQLWYLTAVSALCPFVAVLGARRGRLLEWSFFIVLPLIVVLEWSALAQLTRCWNGQRLELETPTLIGYGLVMLMCLGTYVFSSGRFSVAALVWTSSWSLFVLATLMPRKLDDWSGTPQTDRLATAILQLMFWGIVAVSARKASAQHGWNRVWFEYRDWFGTAWSARLSARINEVAEREQWPWRLTQSGWQLTSSETPPMEPPADDPRVNHALRWLLKPFVDSDWIDERLNAASPTSEASRGHD